MTLLHSNAPAASFDPPRVLVITNGNYFADIILAPVFAHASWQVVGVVIVGGDYRGRSGALALFQYLRTTTLPYAAYKILTQAWFTMASLGFSGTHFSVSSRARAAGVPVRRTPKVNAADVVTWIGGRRPDLIVSVSCPQRVAEAILTVAPRGGINIHSSILPAYAGLAPYFWVLSSGEIVTGCTVHYMTQRFDDGRVLGQRTVSIAPEESAFCLFSRLAVAGGDAMVSAIESALRGNEGTEHDRRGRSYNSHPTLNAYLRLRRNGHVLIRFRELVGAVRTAPAAARRDSKPTEPARGKMRELRADDGARPQTMIRGDRTGIEP